MEIRGYKGYKVDIRGERILKYGEASREAMSSCHPHSGNQSIGAVGVEGVGLNVVFIHDSVPFVVHPGLAEHAGAQLVVLIVLSLSDCDRLEVVGIQLVLRLGEVPGFLGRKTQSSASQSFFQKLKVIFFVIVRELIESFLLRGLKRSVDAV